MQICCHRNKASHDRVWWWCLLQKEVRSEYLRKKSHLYCLKIKFIVHMDFAVPNHLPISSVMVKATVIEQKLVMMNLRQLQFQMYYCQSSSRHHAMQCLFQVLRKENQKWKSYLKYCLLRMSRFEKFALLECIYCLLSQKIHFLQRSKMNAWYWSSQRSLDRFRLYLQLRNLNQLNRLYVFPLFEASIVSIASNYVLCEEKC